MEFDLESGVAVGWLEGAEGGVAAHALHEDADEVEADAGAAGVGAFGEEGAWGWDGGGGGLAVVADGEDDLAGVLAGGQFDAEGVAGGVPGAVIEEVAEDDLDRGGVGEHVGVVDGAAGLDGALEGWFPVAEDVVDGLGEVEGLGEDGSAAFDAGQFEGAIDLGFEAGGVVEEAVEEGADVGVLVVEVGEGFGLESDAGEGGAEFVGDGGEEGLEGAGAAHIAPVEVADEGEAEEEGAEEGGTFPEEHALGAEPLAFGGGVGDAELFFEDGDFIGLGEHEVDPPGAEGDEEGEPEHLEGDEEGLGGGSPAAGVGAEAAHDRLGGVGPGWGAEAWLGVRMAGGPGWLGGWGGLGGWARRAEAG